MDYVAMQALAFLKIQMHWLGLPREILNKPFTQLETSIKINDTLRKRNQS